MKSIDPINYFAITGRVITRNIENRILWSMLEFSRCVAQVPNPRATAVGCHVKTGPYVLAYESKQAVAYSSESSNSPENEGKSTLPLKQSRPS